MHDRDLAAGQMRMRVVGRRRAVRRPARVRNAGECLEIERVGLRRQVGDTRRRHEPLEDRDWRRR